MCIHLALHIQTTMLQMFTLSALSFVSFTNKNAFNSFRFGFARSMRSPTDSNESIKFHKQFLFDAVNKLFKSTFKIIENAFLIQNDSMTQSSKQNKTQQQRR